MQREETSHDKIVLYIPRKKEYFMRVWSMVEGLVTRKHGVIGDLDKNIFRETVEWKLSSKEVKSEQLGEEV